MGWPDGCFYKGDYCDDLRHGEGTLSQPDGRQYRGQWRRGLQHGEGVDLFPDGTQVLGVWTAGLRDNGESDVPRRAKVAVNGGNGGNGSNSVSPVVRHSFKEADAVANMVTVIKSTSGDVAVQNGTGGSANGNGVTKPVKISDSESDNVKNAATKAAALNQLDKQGAQATLEPS